MLNMGKSKKTKKNSIKMLTEGKIKASELRYRRLFEAAQDGILILDYETGMIVDANPFLARILKFPKGKLVGKHLWELGFFRGVAKNKANFLELKRKKFIRYEDLPMETADGQRIDVEFVSNVYGVGGKNVIQCNIRDITERKKVEQTKMEFISMASHQLRTPPTGVKWFANMLLAGDMGKINPRQRSYLNEILYNNQRMIDLVHSLLSVSRIELGTFFVGTKLARIKITLIINDILQGLRSQIQDKHLIIIKNYGGKSPSIQADPRQLRIILHNLIHNATQYTDNGDKITLGVKSRKSEILITVSDTGFGIPKAQQPNLFSKFFRAENVIGEKTKGTGLGLYIAKTLATAMGGTIEFESALGKGSTFFLTLPIKSKMPVLPK
jgi:PAS domain S-box-containing protein